MHFLLFSQRFKDEDRQYLDTLIDVLNTENQKYSIYENFKKQLDQNNYPIHPIHIIRDHDDQNLSNIDMVLSLGGDGTILTAVTIVRNRKIPIAGINLGRLGFLATIEKSKIKKAINNIIKLQYRVEQRSMLKLLTDKDIFEGANFALNDFTLHKRDDSSMIVIHTYINEEFINSYWADGLVVSTSTGSTGYNLSGGGPIIFPHSNSFVITPIAPHNLNVRPVVLSDQHQISFQIEGRDRNYMATLDSRSVKISADISLSLMKNDWDTHIVMLHETNFINTIQGKLNWGLDSRS